MLDHMQVYIKLFKKSASFPKQPHHFTFPWAMYQGLSSPTSSPALVTVHFVVTAVLVGVGQSLTAVLICISLMSDQVEHLFLCLFISLNLLWTNVDSNLPLIFYLGCFCYYLFSLCPGAWGQNWRTRNRQHWRHDPEGTGALSFCLRTLQGPGPHTRPPPRREGLFLF